MDQVVPLYCSSEKQNRSEGELEGVSQYYQNMFAPPALVLVNAGSPTGTTVAEANGAMANEAQTTAMKIPTRKRITCINS